MKNHFVKFGIIFGAISIIVQLALYLIDVKLLFNTSIGLISAFLVPIIIIVLTLKAVRQDNNDVLSFGDGFKNGWLAYAVGALIASLFTYVLYNFIDPSIIDIQKEATLEMTSSMMERFGAAQSDIDEAIDKIEETDMSYGIGKVFTGWLFLAGIFGTLLSLVIAAIMKKSDPNPLV